jgi:hypothetical protein
MGDAFAVITAPHEFVPGTEYQSTTGSANIVDKGIASLVFQTDGNLVLYDEQVSPRQAKWSSHTASGQVADPGAQCVFQTDGNLVVYDRNEKPIWSSVTPGHANAILCLQHDGNVVIYSAFPDGPVWSTNTPHTDPVQPQPPLEVH